MRKKISEEDRIFKILKEFTIDCVHGGDFDQGNSLEQTLSVLKKWWNNRNKEIIQKKLKLK